MMGASLKERFLNSQLSKKVLFECLFFAGLFLLLYLWYLPYSQVFPYGDDLRSIVGILSNPHGLGAMLTTAGLSYRPVFGVLYYVLVAIFKFNMRGYFVFNLLFQCVIAFILYKKIASITERRTLGMIITFLYAISTFGFYCILQAEGLMELMCMLFVVIFMSALYDILYGDVKKLFSTCCLATISYALVTFTHERFIILAIPLLLTLFFRRKDFLDKKTYVFISVLGILPLLLNVFVKVFIFNIPFFRGTAGIVMDLSSPSALDNIFTHIAYMFGIHNNKLQHMDGILSSQVHPITNIVISISCMSIIALLAIYIFTYLQKNAIKQSVYFVIICIVTIGVMIASSSFTIYVEMRWVYGPYLVALVLLSYIIKIILEFFKGKLKKHTILSCNRIILATVLVYLFSTASYSFYYRHYFPGIFFIQWHEKGEIMYEKFLTPYKNYFQSMSTILIDSAPHVSSRLFLDEFGLEYNRGAFYSLFEKDYKNIDFVAVADVKDINFTEIDKPLLLLYYDNIAKAIIPIVNELYQQEDFSIYQPGIIETGFYDDHWMGKTASIYLVQPTASSIRLAGHCPDNFPNNKLIVTVNGKESAIDIIPGKNFDVSIDYENTGKLVIIELVSDVVFNSAKEGASNDWRDLGVYISNIEFS